VSSRSKWNKWGQPVRGNVYAGFEVELAGAERPGFRSDRCTPSKSGAWPFAISRASKALVRELFSALDRDRETAGKPGKDRSIGHDRVTEIPDSRYTLLCSDWTSEARIGGNQ
jgi:hypothetical protein